MCSMALVHFRVKRVFYARNSRNGVLKEGLKWRNIEKKPEKFIFPTDCI